MDAVTKAAYITGGATVLGGSIAGVFAYFNNKKKTNKPALIVRLHTHHIWFVLDDLEQEVKRSFKVPQTVHNWRVKQEVYRDIMLNKISIWRKILSSFLDKVICQGNCEKCHLIISMEQSRKLHMKMVDEGVEAYTTYYIDNPKYNKQEKKCLDIAMPKFNNIHDPKVTDVTEAIDRAHQITEYFPDWCPIRSAAVIFSTYETAFTKMKRDIEEAIITLNGDLDGLTFKRK